MSDTKTTSSSGGVGVGFAGLLTLIFITLKLMDQIDWSWWWVLSPLWFGAGLVIVIFALAILALFLARR